MPQILGLTASPFLTLEVRSNKSVDIQDVEENLILLCKNLDSKFLSYDDADIQSYLKQAEIDLCVYKNDIFVQKLGENFLSFIENFDSKFGSFQECLELIPYFRQFYQDFHKKIVMISIEKNHSKQFKELIQEIDKYMKRKSFRILHELGLI